MFEVYFALAYVIIIGVVVGVVICKVFSRDDFDE